MNEQLKPYKTVAEIAKKHRMEVSDIQKQLDMGAPIEHEHTKNQKLAIKIALQHLDEIPDYYSRLKKMEAAAKKAHKKFKDVKEETTSGDQGLRDWFGKSKSSTGKKGWVQLGGKFAGKPCARQPGQTSTPKCGSSKMAANLSPEEEERARLRKNLLDPNQPEKSGGAKPTNVRTEEMDLQEVKDKPGKGSGKKDACYNKVKSRYDVWPSAYASGALVKCRKVGAANWGTKTEETQMIRYCPKCKKDETQSECKYGPKFWGMYSTPSMLTTNQLKYDIAQVHPANESKEPDHEYSMARSELSTIISAAKRLRGKLKDEGNIEAWVQSKITKAADYIDAAADYLDSGEHNVGESVSIEDANGNPYVEFIDIIKPEPLKSTNLKTFGQFVSEAKKSEMKCNSPKSEPVGNSLTGKSHVVKACEGGKEKLIRFGQRGVKGSPKKKGESKAYASRRHRFQTRHAKNISKGKMSAAYWSNLVKW